MTNTMTYKGYAARIAYDDEDGILTGQIAGLRDGVCEVMAEMGEGPYAISEVATKSNTLLKSLSTVRDNLIKKGMIYSSSTGYIAFTVPMFDSHLRRVGGK
ncbi:hypothetical protein SAMN05444339_11522 [Loktanella atrilutea]|uniref:Uncharacterized protein n=1 Tax=Loktanella atrilutea TaxID=366533 RepID=A0A1M5EVT7_LOKAT|nr:hypothetical protein [Loktanella atrilutea]SHF83328.1 hypothetical protein SAMN05444339_11522 [Loktanella atrilutea]